MYNNYYVQYVTRRIIMIMEGCGIPCQESLEIFVFSKTPLRNKPIVLSAPHAWPSSRKQSVLPAALSEWYQAAIINQY